MKKILFFIFITVTIVSCKDKLPSNISFALSSVNTNVESLNQIDSTIMNLTDNDIQKLSSDSARSLYVSHNFHKQLYDESYEELNELLKLNPVYSDYDEIKNRRYHFTIEKKLTLENGYDKILKNLDKLFEKSMN